jgi:hypothetical protein
MQINCPISGITYTCSHIPVSMSQVHPIFTLPYPSLIRLYTANFHSDTTTPTDQYLTFLAILNSIEALNWRVPCTLKPSSPITSKLIANNIAQLIAVVERTNAITIASFEQPGYAITSDNSNLEDIDAYIAAWQYNIDNHHHAYRQDKLDKKVSEVELKLQYLINSGEELLTAVKIAEWAHLTATFPNDSIERYKLIIRSCYNANKMFSYKVTEIEEVRDYCYASILPGSIYMHKLIEVLQHGIELNRNYLGYTILDTNTPSDLDIILATAPTAPPRAEDYPDKMALLKAKIKYSIALSEAKNARDAANTVDGVVL